MNKSWANPVDFFATRSHYIDHIAPIWFALDEDVRGMFYVPEIMLAYATGKGLEVAALKPPGVNNKLDVAPDGDGPLVTCAYQDLQKALYKKPRRPMIFMQHGIGLTFPNSAYAGGSGMQRDVKLFLDPNQHTRDMIAKTFPHKPGFVVGTPKLDEYVRSKKKDERGGNASTTLEEHSLRSARKTVCISFHWDGNAIAPEAGNAFSYYKSILPRLAECEQFTLIGHAHPRVMDAMAGLYRSCGIEPVSDFEEVMRRADVYVNDCSSTMYEFLVTGKPVVILNAPWFRKGIHTGIRFWEYTDIGLQVNQSEELLPAILETLEKPDERKDEREKAVAELYPYLGESAKRAASVIKEFCSSKGPIPAKLERVADETIGILYMAFGERAAKEVRKSMMSLRNVGVQIPVCVVGDTPVRGAQFVEWEGQNPFDPTCRKNFQFRAGRIKPGLATLTPFERTLYIDADTEFMADITKGFEFLSEFDMALAEELLSIGKLYNKPLAGWEINVIERDATIKELGGNPNIPFLNSGVIFFRKNERVQTLFEAWGRQWLRWQQWDEQLALMRALYECPVKYKALSVDWNHPHRHLAKIIFHNYGRGVARMNVPSPEGVLQHAAN